jgi:polysaccharide export outer membrane protein
MKMRQKVFILFSIVISLYLLGCAPQMSSTTEAQAAAAQVAQVTPQDQEKYLLGPEDVIEVSVWKEPDMTKQLVVQPDGKIYYPLVGEIRAAGKTVKQLQEEISKRLEKFVTDASVTVILLKTQYYKFYVTGKVNKPGEFLAGRPTSVLQAIAMAGGLTPFASPTQIKIVRKVAGQDEVYNFDYKDVSRGNLLYQNIILQPGDTVVVP